MISNRHANKCPERLFVPEGIAYNRRLISAVEFPKEHHV